MIDIEGSVSEKLEFRRFGKMAESTKGSQRMHEALSVDC